MPEASLTRIQDIFLYLICLTIDGFARVIKNTNFLLAYKAKITFLQKK